LLVLARSPGRLRSGGESCRLEELVPEIVSAHEHLHSSKPLQVTCGSLTPSRIGVSAQIARVAIANILRNAIENTDRGTVTIWIRPAGVVRIQDSGKGMSPEEVGRIYAARARHPSQSPGNGIGLQLIRHISDHLGWELDITSTPEQGTLVVLDMSSSLAEQT
jgi:signal transduction histidine kinase